MSEKLEGEIRELKEEIKVLEKEYLEEKEKEKIRNSKVVQCSCGRRIRVTKDDTHQQCECGVIY